MRFRQAIEVARPPDQVFAYVADLSHAAEWDPGVAESRRLGEGPLGIGARFELVLRFRGKLLPFTYVVTALDEGRQAFFEGEGAKARSIDSVTVEPLGAGTRIVFAGELRLKGVYRVTEPFLRPLLDRMGRVALGSLKAKLEADG